MCSWTTRNILFPPKIRPTRRHRLSVCARVEDSVPNSRVTKVRVAGSTTTERGTSHVAISMTASEIVRIATTVAVAQCICELLARRFVFSGDRYQRTVSLLARNQVKHDKLVTSLEGADETKKQKNAKKLQRAKDELDQVAADVAQQHFAPKFFGSFVFVILYRIFALEYQAKIVAVLPFAPYQFLRRFTQRTLELEGIQSPTFQEKNPVGSLDQACSFLFIYVLCTLSIKYFVTKLVGVSPPPRAADGMSTILNAPRSKKMIKAFGVDLGIDELKEG